MYLAIRLASELRADLFPKSSTFLVPSRQTSKHFSSVVSSAVFSHLHHSLLPAVLLQISGITMNVDLPLRCSPPHRTVALYLAPSLVASSVTLLVGVGSSGYAKRFFLVFLCITDINALQVNMIFAGVVFLVECTLPETYAPVILRRRAQRIREKTGDDNIATEQELFKSSFGEMLQENLLRPFGSSYLLQSKILLAYVDYFF